MKQGFRSQCAIAALMLVFSAFSYVQGQTPSATPDPFVAQLTSSPAGFYSFAGDISANGRFVVFESNGDVATEKIPSKNPDGTPNPNARNNEDGNREIFLIDYAQRRIFQLTNTKNIQKPPASPTPTPTPTATPTPSPGATPTPTPTPTPPDLSLVKIEISNNHPMISLEPALLAGGRRVYTIVFSSNAPDPANFDGIETTALTNDTSNGWNQEVWIYRLPEVDDLFDLSSGDEVPSTPLTGGTFRFITKTVPSRPLRAGITPPPDVVDDNREATISDDGLTIAFISTRDLVPTVGSVIGNADFNPELFFCRTTATGGFAFGTNTYVQGTNTSDTVPGISNTLQQNPSLSANGSKVAFLSRYNLLGTNDDKNAEVFTANFNGTVMDGVRQITKTRNEANGTPNFLLTLNLLSAGRRLSRDGSYVVYESRAVDPTANNNTHTAFLAVFVSKTSDSTFQLAVPRAVECSPTPCTNADDVIHFATFTDYDGSLAPSTLIFASVLNFKPDGTLTATVDDATGLNPAPSLSQRQNQIFATQVVTSSKTYTRLTKNPISTFTPGLNALASNTRNRIAFSLAAVELGGGNSDGSSEVFYLLSPSTTPDSGAVLSYFTAASTWGPLATATPVPSPSPTPTPTPSPGSGLPAGLAPGELSIVRSTASLSPADKNAVGGPEAERSPILPIELNGVSVALNGAAAGLYFVRNSPSEGIRFVVPVGLSAGVVSVVVSNRGTITFRGLVQIVPAQPDIFTDMNVPNGTAVACNVTNTTTSGSGCMMGPFQVTSADSTGTQVPTRLELWVTGTRFATPAETKVSFISGSTTTDIIPTSVRPNTRMFGWDLISITLPPALAGTAPVDYKIIVTVTKSGPSFTSRPEATAPTITIIP